MKYTINKLMNKRTYTQEEINNSALIVHPDLIDNYGIRIEEILHVFEEWSNYTILENPIFDEETWLYFYDSESYYFSLRTDDLEKKKRFSEISQIQSYSQRWSLYKRDWLNCDPIFRIEAMRKALKPKFDNNIRLQELVKKTKWMQIIEFTYWNDQFFWIDHLQRFWSNILWKLIMEYRDN